MQPGAVAVADEDEGARPLLQHEGEILRAHHRRHGGVDTRAADDLASDRGRERGLALVVAQHRIVALVGRASPSRRRACAVPSTTSCRRASSRSRTSAIEAARGAAQLRGLRDDVVGVAGLEHADRHHRGLQRIDVARHDRLDLVDDLRADQDGVDRQMRPRRVPALAFDVDGRAGRPPP